MENDSQIKLEERLKKLVEKYGKRNERMSLNNFMEMLGCEPGEDDGEEELNELLETLNQEGDVDVRPMEYHFHYEKVKDESFKLTADFDLEKSNKSKYQLHLVFFDNDTVEALRGMIEDPDLYNEPASLSTEALYYAIHDLRVKYHQDKYHVEGVKTVLDLVEELYKDKYKKIDKMIEEGIINFDSLWYYLDKADTLYIVKSLKEDICFRYKVFSYRTDMKEEPLSLFGEVIQPTGTVLNICQYIHHIPKFAGTKKLDAIKIELLTDEKRQQMLSYGKKIVEEYKNIHHMKMEGEHFSAGPNNAIISHRRNERVVFDCEGMEKYSNSPIDFDVEKAIDVDTFKEDDYTIVFPMVPVYNLGINKQWGLTHIRNLSEITYKEDSFDYLVLDESKKSIIKCLIKNKDVENEYSDFIEGKGNGLVFLLYGSPGTGKTFTAEATCELLRKPLYSINVGDLGTDPEHMESIMNMVFDYARRWDAIIMMDEIDVFLEERETNAILRNAMVGIFLKILEYHNGIIFLTTNRLHSLDSAVKSRINLMISYQEFGSHQRAMIWEALFKKWDLDVSKGVIDDLSHHTLNGREIRNYMKIVFAIHKERGLELTGASILQVFRECLDLTKEFNKSIGAPNSMFM